MAREINMFVIYAREDKDVKLGLLRHLKPFKEAYNLSIWHDDHIEPGQQWKPHIDSRLNQTDIFLLLVSVNFMNSKFIDEVEFKTAIDRHREKKSVMIPVIIDYCQWDIDFSKQNNFNLNELQVLPEEAKPIGDWKTPDQAYNNIAAGIRKVIISIKDDHEEEIRKKSEGIVLKEEADAKRIGEAKIKAEEAEVKAKKEEDKRKAKEQERLQKEKTEKDRLHSETQKRKEEEEKERKILAGQNQKGKQEKLKAFISKPVVWISALALVLLIAGFQIFSNENDPGPPNPPEIEIAKTDYQNLLLEAEALFDKEDYVTAKSKNNEAIIAASEFNLDITEAEKGIKACDAKIKELADQQSNKEKTDNYNNWNKKGDIAFNNGNYIVAKEFYSTAAIYDDNSEIKQKIRDCERKLIPPPPTAKFKMDKSTCIAPCKITFINLSENASKFIWKVNDKEESEKRDFQRSFNSAGKYNIKLIADNGSKSITYEQFIQIDAPQKTATPVAKFKIDKSTCIAPCTISFENISENASDFLWKVNNKGVSKDRNLKHTFRSPGKYSINLIAFSGSKQNAYQQTVNIVKAPAPLFDPAGVEYTIQQRSTDRFLDAYTTPTLFKNSPGKNYYSPDKNYYVVTRTVQKNNTQRWILSPLGSNTYTIQQKSSGRFLDVHVTSDKNYFVVTQTAQNNNTQRWILSPLGSNTYTIQLKSNGQFLDAHVTEAGNFAVVTRTAQNNNTQRWVLIKVK